MLLFDFRCRAFILRHTRSAAIAFTADRFRVTLRLFFAVTFRY